MYMGIKTRMDISDILAEIGDAPKKVESIFETMGNDAVGYAREHGSYKDRTGDLRRNTHYQKDRNHLRVENDMFYASFVEHRGYDVLTGAEDYVHEKYKLKQ